MRGHTCPFHTALTFVQEVLCRCFENRENVVSQQPDLCQAYNAGHQAKGDLCWATYHEL